MSTAHSIPSQGIAYQPLYLKPGSEVVILEDTVQKRMSLNEVEAYKTLATYAGYLRNDHIRIVVPELVDYDSHTGIGTMTKIGNFELYSPMKYFGLMDAYNESYYRTLTHIAALIRKEIPTEDLYDKTDYNAIADDEYQMIHFLSGGMKGSEPEEIRALFEKVKKMIIATHHRISRSPLLASHRDLHPNNYAIRHYENIIEVALIDWEIFGMARKGYDEGRFLTNLALDQHKQRDYIRFINSVFSDEAGMVHFWGTAITRAFREVTLTYHGCYDSRIISAVDHMDQVFEQKRLLYTSFVDMAERGLEEIKQI